MPDLNDFYAFDSTSGSGGGFGCSGGFWSIIIIIALLALFGKCCG